MRKKFWIFFLTMVLLSHTFINAQWVEQNSGVTTSLWDICFVDSLTGWAVGISSTVLHTIDGGNTWNKQQLPRNDLELNEILMLDKNNGFLIGNIGRHSAFLSTTNGGYDWEIKFEDDSLKFGDIEFFDTGRGWLTRWMWYEAGEILYTEDGGKSWAVKVRSDKYNTQPEPYLFSGISFADNETGYAIAQRSSFDGGVPSDIFKTTDGGENWFYVDSLSGISYGIKALNRDSVWVWGEIWSKYTINGGSNWYETDVASIDMTFYKDTKIWSIADTSGFDPRLRVLESEDNGLTWKKIFTSDTPRHWFPDWRSITNYGENYLWICGTEGKIRKYTPVTAIKDDRTIKREFNPQVSVYPNPFNPSTKIEVSLPFEELIELTVYDISGKIIKRLFNGKLKTGQYFFGWNGTNIVNEQVSTGIYLINFKSKSKSITSKVLLLK